MAITKKDLKNIVKECLIEILAEGIGPSAETSINETARKLSSNKPIPSTASVLRQNASKIKLQHQQQSIAIKEAIRREAGGNDVMASILADTAERTLPAMLENDRSRLAPPVMGGAIERTVASHTPDELFGEEVTSKWADLAFTGVPNK